MSLSFVALDFETANSFRGSPCAVGMVRVLDGEVVETRRLLMRPPSSVDGFDDFNIGLHGITPAMVKGEPRFRDRLPEIVAFVGDLPVVAHNAAFDLGVIRDACDESNVRWPTLERLLAGPGSPDLLAALVLAALGRGGSWLPDGRPPRPRGRRASSGSHLR